MEEAEPVTSDESDKQTPLRLVRLSTKQTLEDVEKATGIDVGSLSRIERGKQAASTETASKLARHFGPALIDELRILYPERYMQ